MRNSVAAVCLLAAAGFVGWLVLKPHAKEVEVGDGDAVPATPAQVAPPAPFVSGPRTAPKRTARPDAGKPRATGTTAIVGRGSVRVALTTPAGEDLGTAVRLDVDSLGATLEHYPLAARQDDGSWLYASLPVGKYRVRAIVPGFQSATVEAKVAADEETSVALPLAVGGEIDFKTLLYSGEPPESIR